VYPGAVLASQRFTAPIAWLVQFGIAHLLSCVMPIGVFLALAVAQLLPETVPRYDFLLVACLFLQWVMLASKLETRDELRVICVFHALGLTLELFKVHHGSWSYPDEAFSKIGGVPLYSGFMYASVASYLCQAWRRFDARILRPPPLAFQWGLAAAIYLNFFTHHYLPDVRWGLASAVLIVFRRTTLSYRTAGGSHGMPLPVAYMLIGLFIWIAENFATALGAWQYPSQAEGWQVVDLGKFSAWCLLVIVSFIVVAALKQVKAGLSGR
jgi:uncharacterized membrane protein YoaT (DUF817 family)